MWAKSIARLCASMFSSILCSILWEETFICCQNVILEYKCTMTLTQYVGWLGRGRDPEISHSISRQHSASSSRSYKSRGLRGSDSQKAPAVSCTARVQTHTHKHTHTQTQNLIQMSSVQQRNHHYLLPSTFKKLQLDTTTQWSRGWDLKTFTDSLYRFPLKKKKRWIYNRNINRHTLHNTTTTSYSISTAQKSM